MAFTIFKWVIDLKARKDELLLGFGTGSLNLVSLIKLLIAS